MRCYYQQPSFTVRNWGSEKSNAEPKSQGFSSDRAEIHTLEVWIPKLLWCPGKMVICSWTHVTTQVYWILELSVKSSRSALKSYRTGFKTATYQLYPPFNKIIMYFWALLSLPEIWKYQNHRVVVKMKSKLTRQAAEKLVHNSYWINADSFVSTF